MLIKQRLREGRRLISKCAFAHTLLLLFQTISVLVSSSIFNGLVSVPIVFQLRLTLSNQKKKWDIFDRFISESKRLPTGITTFTLILTFTEPSFRVHLYSFHMEHPLFWMSYLHNFPFMCKILEWNSVINCTKVYNPQFTF